MNADAGSSRTTHSVLQRSPVSLGRLRLRRALTGLAAASVLWLLWLSWEAWRLAQANDQLQAQGLPMQPGDLFAQLPDEQNAVVWYERAFIHMSDENPAAVYRRGRHSELNEVFFDARSLMPAKEDEPLSAAAVELIRSPATEKVIDLLAAGSRQPGLQWQRDYDVVDLAIPESIFSTMASHLVLLAAEGAWHRGDDSVMREHLLTVMRMNRHWFQAAVCLIDLSWAQSAESGLHDALAKAYERGVGPDASQLSDLWRIDLRDDLRRVIAAERLWGDRYFRFLDQVEVAVHTADSELPEVGDGYAHFWWAPLRMYDQRVSWRAYPVFDRLLQQAQQVDGLWLDPRLFPEPNTPSWFSPLSSHLAFDFRSMIAMQANIESRRRVLRIAAALQPLARQGDLPEAIDGLSLEKTAADDRTRPISYQRLSNGTARLAVKEISVWPSFAPRPEDFHVFLAGSVAAARSSSVSGQ